MSKGFRKYAKAATQTAKRHTSVPVTEAETAEAVAPPETVAAPAETGPVVAATVTPIEVEVAAVEATTTAVETSVTIAVATPVEVAAAPIVDAQLIVGLIRDLRHPDADIAREAAIALAATGSSAAVEALIEVLENAEGFYHSVVRAAAAGSLAKLGDKRAVASLLFAVKDTMAEAMAAEAVRALAELGDARAVDTLVGVVRNDSGFFLPVVRLAAVHALGRFDSAQAAAELSHVAADPNEDTVIRNAAAS